MKGVLDLLSVLSGYLPSSVLDGENRRVGPDGVCARHVAIVSNEPGNTHFKVTVSWAAAVDGVDVSVTLGLGDFSADLGFMEGEQGLLGLRAGLG